jgi:hypothetical protein
MCIAGRWIVNCTYVYSHGNIIVYLLYLLFQENKSFGVRTIWIHPLMWEAVLGTWGNQWLCGVKIFRQLKVDLWQYCIRSWECLMCQCRLLLLLSDKYVCGIKRMGSREGLVLALCIWNSFASTGIENYFFYRSTETYCRFYTISEYVPSLIFLITLSHDCWKQRRREP